MLELLLLQLFMSLLPVLAFVIWYDRPDRQKGIPTFIGAVSAVSMLLCYALRGEVMPGLEIDFRMVPYLIGSLYGGFGSFSLLTVIDILFRILIADEPWEWAALASFVGIFAPSVGLSIRHYRTMRAQLKRRMAAVLQLLFGLVFIGSASAAGGIAAGSDTAVYNMGISMFLTWPVLIIMSAVYLIESGQEKQSLHDRLRSLSGSYRNEVQKLQQFIDITPLGVAIVDQDGIITHINDQALRYTRSKNTIIDRLSLIGRSYTELSDGMADSVDIQLIRAALSGGVPTREIVQDHQRIHLKTAFPVRDAISQAVIGAAVITHDITEVTRLKDEIHRVERLGLVGQMAASITHEIRNPMAVIRGFVQLLSERSPQQQQEYFRIIIEELDRANGIISDFLSLAQNRVIEKRKQSLHAIVHEMMPLLWADANMRGQTIDLDLCEMNPELHLNEKEIKQLILNLARNGLEAMKNQEQGKLSIATRMAGDTVELTITDTGEGIPPEKLDRLFEPFFTTKSNGTGLGLPLCLSIVEQHNGSINVASEVGSGTVFTVAFRLEPSLERLNVSYSI